MSDYEAGTAVAVVDDGDERALVAQSEMTVSGLVGQQALILQAMEAAMIEGVHYGVIQGVSKPSLYKPGAEMLNVLFRLAPSYEPQMTWHDDGHLTVFSKCRLTHIPTGLVIAEGEGLCTTRETKYAYRSGKRTCPACGADAIVRSQKNKAFFCISNEGGCGNRYSFTSDEGKALEQQDTKRQPNPDLPDTYNTVLKMGDKRALVAASLNATGASALFTQDVEDGPIAQQAHAQETQRTFDPLTDFLPGATKTWDETVKVFASIDGNVPWGVWLEQASSTLFGKADWRRGLDEEEGAKFWTGVANVAHVLAADVGGRDFPPVTRAECQKAFATILDGQVLAGPLDFAFDPDEAAVLAASETPEAETAAEAVAVAETGAPAASGQKKPEDIEFGEPAGYENPNE